MIIWANLDCEARWAGVALPKAVLERLRGFAHLLEVLGPPGATIVPPGETPPRYDRAWADPGAKAVNDRAATLAFARSIGAALPGSRVVAFVDEIDIAGDWVAKARWTAAGRDRARGTGAPTGELRARCANLIAKHGPLVIEPWMARTLDVGTCGRVAADGAVTLASPHGLLVDARGGFRGIDLAPPPLLETERAELARVARACGASLAARGYAGPFSVDAFVYDGAAGRALHPLCELNARETFGSIAHARRERTGSTQLSLAAS